MSELERLLKELLDNEARRPLPGTLEKSLFLTDEIKDRIRALESEKAALEARVIELEADHELGINWKAKLNKAEAALAAAVSRLWHSYLDECQAEGREPSDFMESEFKRAAGRDATAENSVAALKAGLSDPGAPRTAESANVAAKPAAHSHPPQALTPKDERRPDRDPDDERECAE